MITEHAQTAHPCEAYVKFDDTPSVWCTGCGIGTVLNAFVQTVVRLALDPKRICVVTGSGCSGKIAEYLKFRSLHVASSDVIGHALAFRRQHPDHTMIVFTSNMDFCIDGTSDLQKAGKDKCQLCVIHINNIVYTITKYGSFAATPFTRQSENHKFELPFNMPHIAKLAGARYIARWTSLHVRRLMHSMIDAMQKSVLSFVEIISPCVIYNAINENIGETLGRARFCHDNSTVRSDTPTSALDIRNNGNIVMGVFVDETALS